MEQHFRNINEKFEILKEDNSEKFSILGVQMAEMLVFLRQISEKLERSDNNSNPAQNDIRASKINEISKEVEKSSVCDCGANRLQQVLGATSQPHAMQTHENCSLKPEITISEKSKLIDSLKLSDQNQPFLGEPDTEIYKAQTTTTFAAKPEEKINSKKSEENTFKFSNRVFKPEIRINSVADLKTKQENKAPEISKATFSQLSEFDSNFRKCFRHSDGIRPATMASTEEEYPDHCSPAPSIFSCAECLPTKHQCSLINDCLSPHPELSWAVVFPQFIGLAPFNQSSAIPQKNDGARRTKQEKNSFFASEYLSAEVDLAKTKHLVSSTHQVTNGKAVQSSSSQNRSLNRFLTVPGLDSNNSKPMMQTNSQVYGSNKDLLNDATRLEPRIVQNRADLVSSSDEENNIEERSLLDHENKILPPENFDSSTSQAQMSKYLNNCVQCASNNHGQSSLHQSTPLLNSCFRYSRGVRRATMASLDDGLRGTIPILSPPLLRKKYSISSTCSCAKCCLLSQSQCSSSSDTSSEPSFHKIFPKFVGIPSSCLHPIVPKLAHEATLLPQKDKFLFKAQNSDRVSRTDPLQFEHEHSSLMNEAGVMGVAGCVATFQKNTFDEPVEVKLLCSFPTQIFTFDGIVVTPEVSCLISDNSNPRRPFFISLPTCYVHNSKFSDEAVLMVQHYTSNEKWQTLMNVKHEKELLVEFATEQMGRFRCIAPSVECHKLSKNMLSVVFLQQHCAQSKYLKLVWCILDDLPHLEAKMWLELTPRSVYKRLLPSKPFAVGYNQGVHLLIEEDENFENKMSSIILTGNEMWHNKFYRKFEFSLLKTSKYIDGKNFKIRNDKRDLLLEYSGEIINLPGILAKRNRSFIHDTLSVKSSNHSNSSFSLDTLSNSFEATNSRPTCSRSVKKFGKLVRSESKKLQKKLSKRFK